MLIYLIISTLNVILPSFQGGYTLNVLKVK
nr:MAG TPA: hypothetical protein [Caudoviricetes sp.]